jgi:uncharacterized protein (TIGR03437 family)
MFSRENSGGFEIEMSRLMIASTSILIVAAGAATLNFTFSVTSASITTSGTNVSVSGPATLTVSGVGSDSGTFSASGSLANISGGNVTVAFTDTFGHGTVTGNMTFPEGVLVGSAPVSGSATITSGTGLYAGLANTTVTGTGFTGSVLSGGTLSFSISGAANGRQFTFTVTNASVSISGTSMFSGAASFTLGGNSPDTGTFSATGSLTNISGGNLTVPFTVTLDHGTLTGSMTFPENVLVNSGPVSGSATITGGTGSYAGLTSSTLTASGTVTGSVLSGGTPSVSISGAVNTGGSGGGTDITYNVNVKITSSNPTKNPLQSDAAVGTITTDGTIGTILAHNIKSWDLQLIDFLNSANNFELTTANSVVVEDGDGAGQKIGGGGLTATATGLFYDFSNKNAEFGFQASASLYSGGHYFCLSDGLYACAAGESIAPNDISKDGVIATPAPAGNQPLNGNTPTITNVVSGASYGIGMAGFSGTVITGIESGSWVIITGQGLASNTRIWQASDFAGLGNALPMSLDGVSLTINGKPAAVYYISPTQLNVQAPQDGTLGSVPVVVTNSLGQSNSMNATLQQYAPGFFLLSQPGSPSPTAALYVAAVHNDGTPAVPANYYGSSVNSRPATPGEVLMIYGTGFGPANPPAPAGQLVDGAPPLADPSLMRITIGGVPATVQYAGLVGPGEYQFNVVVPTLSDGDQPIVATIGGSTSQTGVSVSVKN